MTPSNFVLLILTFIFIRSDASYNILDFESRPLISYLLASAPPSKCVTACLEPLRKPLADFVNTGMTIKTQSAMCINYNRTLDCVYSKNRKCSVTEQRVVQKMTVGFGWACNTTLNPFENHTRCMVALGKEARLRKNCSKECGMAGLNLTGNSIGSKDSKFPNVFERFESFCEPLACYLNCTALQMNAVCPIAGTNLIHVILNGFDALIEELAGATPEEKYQLQQLAPSKCRRWLSNREIMNVRVDRRLVAQLFFLIGSLKTRDVEWAASEAERIVSILSEEVESNSYRPPAVRPYLDWDWPSRLTLTGIVAVMLLNVVGLVFTIWWCVSKSKGGEPNRRELDKSDDIAMSQFLEPNIRMKLKLPKMRSDAIHDSSQEVLELRVPRNGNQFHQNDEQTVVVPRSKRRRTYSVPLEPRPRTQSTGSEEHSSQILILRNHENC